MQDVFLSAGSNASLRRTKSRSYNRMWMILRILALVEIAASVESVMGFMSALSPHRMTRRVGGSAFVSTDTRSRHLFLASDDWEDRTGELVNEDGEGEEDWLPDREKARQIREQREFRSAQSTPSDFYDASPAQEEAPASSKKSVYTVEQQELIEALGGKQQPEHGQSSKREAGFLGDSTLKEIAHDYQMPICYLVDVLATWGSPVPINVHSKLGDLVSGEQAFAILEAIHSLDMGVLYDRYSDFSITEVCNEYNIELKDAFEMAIKEAWNLPFGVNTFLRVEQEEELIRVLCPNF
jgi:hypothetical protein